MKQSDMITLVILAGLLSVLIDMYQSPLWSLTHWLSLGLMIAALMLQFVWQSWRKVCIELEPVKTEIWGELLGDPEFDPTRGIVASVLCGTDTVKVVLQPKWWQYFSSDLLRNEKEGNCAGSPVSLIEPGREPNYLVVIQDENGFTRGMASRAIIGSNDVMLTAFHVIDTAEKLYISKYSPNEKTGKRIEIDFSNWKLDFFSRDSRIDIASIFVPQKVWSSLGVKSVKVKVPTTGRKPVQLFGADSSAKCKSSVGLGTFVSEFTGEHTATTTKGWSGSPVISNGVIIGVHRGVDVDKLNSNKFTIIHPSFFPSGIETMYDYGHIRELDDEQFETRETEFSEAYLHGRGKIHFNESEFSLDVRKKPQYRPIRGDWREADFEEDFFEDKAFLPNLKRNFGMEAGEGPLYVDDLPAGFSIANSRPNGGPLNGKRAEKEQSSPPCVPLVDIPSQAELLSEQLGCPSLTLEDRVSNLEKLLEPLLASVQLLQETVSLNLKTLTGQNAEALRNSIPSSSKQPDSKQPKHPSTSGKQSSNLSKSTLELPKEIASKENGTQQPSKPKSKRSRRRKSKGIPPQGSPLPA
nr:MAG: polyprotein P2a [Sobemovirus sp.]